MFKTTEGAADCEMLSVIRFLNARNVLPSEIHHQICQVYGDNAMICAHLTRILETVTLRTCSDYLSSIEKTQTPFRVIRVMFMFVPVR